MSFTPKTESPVLTPSTPDRRNTFQEAVAVPFANGYFRLAPKWFTDRFNDHWSNGKDTGQAYCSVAGVLCHGPINHIRASYSGGGIVGMHDIFRPTDSGDPEYYKTTIEFGGIDADLGITNRITIYWGDEADTVDTWLNTTSGQDHPPHRGLTKIICERLHCGQIRANSQARPALPNIEFTGYRLPSPSMPADLIIPPVVDGNRFRGVNLVSAMWDILTHKRGGLGISPAKLNEADWIAKAQALEDGTKPAGGLFGPDAYISPVLAGAAEAEKYITDVLEYIDGWLYEEDGLICIDWYPNDGTIPEDLPEITEHDLVRGELPKVQTASLAESPTTIVVECLDGDQDPYDLAPIAPIARVPFVQEITGESVAKKLQRPYITSHVIGAHYAEHAARQATIPAMRGECVVRLSRAVRLDGTPLRIGDIFKFNYAPQSLLVVCRLIEFLEDETSRTLRWERERGVSSQPYVAAPDPRVIFELPDPPTPDTSDWIVKEAPFGLLNSAAAIVLARRTVNTVSGVRVYLDDDNTWASGSCTLGDQNFAAKVELDATIDDNDTACVLNGTDPDVSPFLGSGVSSTEQTDNTLLLLIGDEWMSIGAVTSAGAGSYNVAIARGRLGSAAIGHLGAAVGWVVRRDRIKLWQHAIFTENSTRYFKISLFHALAEGTLSAAKSLTFATRAPAPVTSFTAIALPGSIKITWDNPEPVDGFEIFENTTASLPTDPTWFVAYPAVSFTRDDVAPGDTLYFWMRSYKIPVTGDLTGPFPLLYSTVVGPVNATALAVAGATVLPRGPYDATKTYFDTDDLKNTVTHAGSVWKTDDVTKNATSTWGTPGVDPEWIPYDGDPDLGGTFSTGTGDGQLNASPAGSTFGNTSSRHIAMVTSASGTTVLQAKQGGTAYATLGAFDIGGSDRAGQLTLVDNLSGGHTGILTASALTFDDANIYRSAANTLKTDDNFIVSLTLTIGADTNLYRSAADKLKTDDTFIIGAGVLEIGADCNLYRSSANNLKTDDSLEVVGTLTVGTFSLTNLTVTGTLTIGADCNLYRDSANVLKSDDSLVLVGTITVGNGGILIGADCAITRAAADSLATTDAFAAASFNATGNVVAGGYVATSNSGIKIGADCEITRVGSHSLSSPDSLALAGTLSANTVATDAIVISGSCNLYEYISDVLKTDDHLWVVQTISLGDASVSLDMSASGTLRTSNNFLVTGNFSVSGAINIGADCDITRVGANQLSTGDSFSIGGGLTVTSGITSTALVNTSATYQVGGTNVVGARQSGFAAQTASASGADLGASPTGGQIASWIAKADAALKAHGLFGT